MAFLIWLLCLDGNAAYSAAGGKDITTGVLGNLYPQLKRPDLMVRVDHANYWSGRHGTFGESVLLPLYRIAEEATIMTDTILHAAAHWCGKACEKPGVCRFRALYVDITAARKTFAQAALLDVPKLSFGMLGSAKDLVHALVAAVESEIEEHEALNSGDEDTEECANDMLNVNAPFELLYHLHRVITVFLNKLHTILAGQTTADYYVPAVHFTGAGMSCMSWQGVCDTSVQLAVEMLFNRSGTLYVAEIGVDHGVFSLGLARKMPNTQILAVDPYDGRFEVYPDWERAYDFVHAKAAPFRDRYQLIKQSSRNASKWIGNGVLDLVFIDAIHTYVACSADVRYWRPKLKEGGILLFHDYSLHFPGVMRCVHEAAMKWAKGRLYVTVAFLAYFEVSHLGRPRQPYIAQ